MSNFTEFYQFKSAKEYVDCLIENDIDPIQFALKTKIALEQDNSEEAVYQVLAELAPAFGGMVNGVKNWLRGTKNTDPGTGYTAMRQPNIIGKAMGMKTGYGQPVSQDAFQQSANQGVNVDPAKQADYAKAINGLYGLLQPLKNLGFNIRNIQDIIAKLKAKVNTPAPTETDQLVNKMRQMRGQPNPGIQKLAPLPQS